MSEQVKTHYSIQELSSAYGVTPRTLRHYEEQGLLSPQRDGQLRIYHEADRVRLDWILRGKRVGFSLSEIGEMLSLYDLDDGRKTQRAVTLKYCDNRVKALEAQRDDINATIKELKGFRTLLSNLDHDSQTGKWINTTTGEPVASYTP